MSVRPGVRLGGNSIKIGIADTGDQILDSGLFLTNFQFLKDGTTRDEIFKVISGAIADNDLTVSDLREEVQLASGTGTVSGSLTDLDGDIVRGFTDQTTVVVDGDQVSLLSTEILSGAAVLRLDGDADGTADAAITFEGNYQGAVFSTKQNGDKTQITVDLSQATTTQDTATQDTTDFDKRATQALGTAPTDLNPIRDYDGNDLGAGSDWTLIGEVDVEFDGDAEFIYANQTNGRWATVGPDATGKVDFSDHGQGGDTRVVGIYIDPEVVLDPSKKSGPFDSQQRFQNDLNIDNLTIIDAFDFDGDGFQEIYFKVNDGTAYLRALMHSDGNIQYANYQSNVQVQDYLTGLGYDQSVLDTILV